MRAAIALVMCGLLAATSAGAAGASAAGQDCPAGMVRVPLARGSDFSNTRWACIDEDFRANPDGLDGWDWYYL